VPAWAWGRHLDAMFQACRPEACRKVYKSGHSVSFDDEEVTAYSSAQDVTLPAPRGHRPAVEPAPDKTSAFAVCSKPQIVPDEQFPPEEKKLAEVPAASKTVAAVPPPAAPVEDPGYALLEGGDSDDEEFAAKTRNFVRQISEVRKTMNSLQFVVAVLLVVASVLALCLSWVAYQQMVPEHQIEARRIALLASIPIVACLFTWFHIWMAIQMMFRPLEFFGLWQYASTGMGIGWQGVVPRKAQRMATMGYDCARPYIQGPRDIMGAVNPKSLVAKTRPQLVRVIEQALAKVGAEHFPWTDRQMGPNSKKKIAETAVDRIIETCPELWAVFTELLSDKKTGIDNDGMFVKVFTENKVLLNNFFLSLGEREFRFIEHCGAVMGFICGMVQLIAFNNLSGTTRVVFLPLTGFFLGIFSNWLAIQMVFKPVFPVPVWICGWHIYDIQGLFIKRQQEVCVLYSKMVVDNFLNFDKIVDYLMTQPKLWNRLKVAYLEHNTKVMKEAMGVIANWLAPWALGQQQFAGLEESMKTALVQGLYEAKDIHKIAGRYVGKVTGLERKNCAALQQMPPDKFENLLHPIFQEDEWILVLLGGVLGVMVGMGQIYFLS